MHATYCISRMPKKKKEKKRNNQFTQLSNTYNFILSLFYLPSYFTSEIFTQHCTVRKLSIVIIFSVFHCELKMQKMYVSRAK